MADQSGSAALAPSSAPSFSAPVSGAAALGDRAQGMADDVSGKIDKIESSRTQAHDDINAARDNVKPPEPVKPIDAPKTEPTSPVKEWGSAAMMLAMLASAFTKRPFLNAMTAASATLDAFHKNDVEAATQAFNKWKIENENALKAQEYQNQAYQKIMAGLDRREHMADQQADSQERAVTAAAHAQAVAFGDQKFQYILETQGIKAAQQYQRDQQNFTERVRENAGKVEDQMTKQQAIYEGRTALHASPEYQSAPPTKKAAMDLALVNKFDHPSFDQMTASQRANLEVKLHKELDTTGVGKPYLELQSKWPIMNEAERQLKETGRLNAQTSAAVVDGFQRIYNNQAVRIGLVQLNTQHAPYMDQLAQEASKWTQGGGGVLAPRQAADMLALMHEYRDNIQELRENQVQNYRDLATGVGADPDVVANPRYYKSDHEAQDEQAHGAPAAMKQDPQHVLSAGVGVPVTITSNRRSAGHNAEVGGSPSSEHLSGNAWDFVPHGIGMEEAAGKLAANMRAHNQPFDQIEFTPTHVHIGFGPKNRGEVIDQNGRHYRLNGSVSAGNKPAAGTQFASAADVRAAVAAGSLPRDQAVKILQSQFGMD